MQAADLGYSNDGPERRRLNASRNRCIPPQGEVRPGFIVVEEVLLENPLEVVLVENDEVVEAFSADGPGHPFSVGVLPGRLGRGEDLPDTNSPDDPPALFAVGTIPIPQEVARLGAVPGKGLPDLLGGPSGGRMGGDVEVNDAPTVVGENHETEEKPEGSRGNDEEIAGCRGAKVIPEKGAPSL